MDPDLMKHYAVCNAYGAITDESASDDPDERKPCPDCGSTSRQLTRTASDAVAFSDGVKAMAGKPPEG